MKIKYIAWKKVNSSDVNRLIYGTQGVGLHNTGDQAIQNFNTLNENPGLWTGFTNGEPLSNEGVHITLANSVNTLLLWRSNNIKRKNPVKINMQIWDRNLGHEKCIIETWYLGYMHILGQLLEKIAEGNPDNPNVRLLKNFVSQRLGLKLEIKSNILRWIYDTQDGFCALNLDTSFMQNEHIEDYISFVPNYFHIVVKCEENGVERNLALMANKTAPGLHPEIKALLERNEKGGEYVDIDVSVASTSPDSQRFLSALSNYHNIILYGPPGTGKTHMLTELMNSFAASVLFDDLDTEAPFKVTNASKAAPTAWCTFHPSYSYENFVYGVKPVVINNNLGFKPHIGPFLKQSLAATNGERSLLIIDEINRGRADNIFGNTVAILNHDSDETVSFTHPVTIDGNIINGLSTSNNLFVVGTMNSLDKSTSPLSAELKRRFVIVEVAPSVEVLRSHLQRNSSIDEGMVDFCCSLMSTLNERIRELCGKEFELGQGFFWSLVNAKSNHDDVLSDIICNKVLPHLKDVLPLDSLGDFFKTDNLDVLYTSNEYGYDFKDLSLSTVSQIINAFAVAIDSEYRCAEEPEIEPISFDELDENKIATIKAKLMRHHNVIISGVSGTGKSYIVNKIAKDGYFEQVSKMFWHGSTDYSDTIEGISAVVTSEGKIDYSVLPGMIKQLADSPSTGPKLMIIEGINKSNPAETLGELITLLEADKRSLRIEGYDGDIQLPNNMYFICTCNPAAENQYKLDSAMKRRFVIANVYPDYKLLSMHLGVDDAPIDVESLSLDNVDDEVIKLLAVQLLKRINASIAFAVGENYQIGHSVFWNLNNNCNLATLLEVFDNIILPLIEELCFDADVARRIFGSGSPAISILPYGVEIQRLSTLTKPDLIEALKGLLSHD